MEKSLSFDFTLALSPEPQNYNIELQYLKALLLYADHIHIVNPLASITNTLNNELSTSSFSALYKTIDRLLNLGSMAGTNVDKYRKTINKLKVEMSKSRIRKVPRDAIRNLLIELIYEIQELIESLYDKNYITGLQYLINKDVVKIHDFEDKSVKDINDFIKWYFGILHNTMSNSTYKVFDDDLYKIMAFLYRGNITDISKSYQTSFNVGELGTNSLMQISSFDNIPFDELLGVKSELSGPLIRYRSKMIEYSEKIKSVPWNDDFQIECTNLYHKEIAPSLLELREMASSNSLMKNLASSLFDATTWKSIVVALSAGIPTCIASSTDILGSFTELASIVGPSVLASPMAVKMAQAAKQKRDNTKKVRDHSLFFYYEIERRYGANH